jgi:vanillate O-demethylase monooxygenase subunit
MRVRVFPILEQPPFVWIWLGPPFAAAGSQPPPLPWINDPSWTTFASAWNVGSNYMMVHEHYLDFSYAPVLHGSDLPPGLESMGAFHDVEVTETTVSYTRVLPKLPLAGWQADATGLDPAGSYEHREGGTFVSPAIHRQYWQIDTPDGEFYTTTRTHGITPETESSTHVFMHSSRNYATGSVEATERLASFLDGVARRDISILEMASAHSGYDGWRRGVEFQSDAVALRARRIVGVMLAKEAGPSAIRPGLAPNSRDHSLSPDQPLVLGG